MEILVGARLSPLSKVQVEEVLKAVKLFYSHIHFSPIWMMTRGDSDKKTSLRTLEKTDFFTKEIDEALISQKCHIAIHSAKDLPDPLNAALKIIALTKGLDPSDSLVLRQGAFLEDLNENSLVATSSKRREEAVEELLKRSIRFCDIRGTIDERLAILDSKAIDGVVIAEAALIRLQYHNRTRFTLPGPTTPLQGQLAIVARKDDNFIENIFSCLDVRR